MSRAAFRWRSRSRALVAIGAIALLALVAFAALLIAGTLADHTAAPRATDAQVGSRVSVGESTRADAALHEFHQQPSTRARGVAFGVVALAVALGAWAFQRVRIARSGRPRTLGVAGLPPGRAPPRFRIA